MTKILPNVKLHDKCLVFSVLPVTFCTPNLLVNKIPTNVGRVECRNMSTSIRQFS